MEQGKTFRDYITDYMTTEKDQRINRLVEVLDLDKDLLKSMLDQQITEQNFDEFGRFSRLEQSVDREKAKAYFEQKTGQILSPIDVMYEIHNLLKNFILLNGIDV